MGYQYYDFFAGGGMVSYGLGQAWHRKVIFVHGCFWHGHKCKRGDRPPNTNRDYWTRKLTSNVKRDAENAARLRAMGWDILIIWECEVRKREELTRRLLTFLG